MLFRSFVVLRFNIRTREILENRRADLHPITVFQDNLARDLVVVAIRSVGAPIIDDDPSIAFLSELRVASRDTVAVEDDLVVGSSTNTRGTAIEDKPFAQERRLFGVDHDEAIVVFRPGTFSRDNGVHDLRNASLFVEVVHAFSARCASVMGRIGERSRPGPVGRSTAHEAYPRIRINLQIQAYPSCCTDVKPLRIRQSLPNMMGNDRASCL